MENNQKLQVLLTLLILIGFHVIGCFGCHRDELEALLQIKAAVNYPNGSSLANWKEEEMGSPANCCNWSERVMCGDNGRVNTLDLDSVRQAEFQGDWYLNASLFLPLRDLQVLNLMNNSITGWTRNLRELSSLQYLVLSHNKLKGMIDLYDLEALQNLIFLQLDGNEIDGFKRINGTTSSTSKLEALYLNNVTFHDAHTLMDSISSFPFLTTLIATGIGLRETGVRLLCRLKNIEELDIGENHLGGQFPLCLRNLTSLQNLRLTDNNLYGGLPSFLENLTSLQFLELSSNQFTENIAYSSLNKLTSLEGLSLSNNKFQIPQTFRSFANHSILMFLLLDNNNLIPDNATHPSFALKFQPFFLSLSNCNIGPTLPDFLLHQSKLIYLDLSNNNIRGSFPAWILENNTFLGTLSLVGNLLRGSLHFLRHPHSQIKFLDVSHNIITSMSANLSQSLPNILFLNLSRNSIQVITPSTFDNMKNLTFLDLSYNHLTGNMPKEIMKGCRSLHTLLLNDNYFSGNISSTLFSESLVALVMSNNNLEGLILIDICKVNHLTLLDLSSNNLFGFLPSCVNGSSLEYVYLNKNKLQGPFPYVFRNSTSLMTLELGDNHLSGVIPNWISDLHMLSILSLRNNHLEGHIPTEFCSLDQLSILDLSFNNISGHIPHCLNQMTFRPREVKSIFVQSNVIRPPTTLSLMNLYFVLHEYGYFLEGRDFHIQLEMEITIKSHTYAFVGKDLDYMSGIDLSSNKLSGEIPPETGRMLGLHALNFSHNELDGLIPSTLSELSQIESLDLSYNNLNGSIPSELIKLNALAVFSVAHNNVSGRTPERKDQFGTFEESSYEGNPFLCGPPLLNDCPAVNADLPEDHNVNDVEDSMDMDIFYISFSVSSTITFVATLIVLYIDTRLRRVWFYSSETWITWIYYFIVDTTRKAWKALKRSVHASLRLTHYVP